VWTIEASAIVPPNVAAQRVCLVFSDVVQARINCNEDSESGQVLVSTLSESPWRQRHKEEYVEKFGTKFLAIITTIKHYVVSGDDLTVGILARDVKCTIIEGPDR